MIDESLLALQQSAFANWLALDPYPTIIILHSVGMALLVGLQVIINLRVLGFGRGLPIPALRRFMTVVWIGFWVNAISGTLLFVISPDKLFHSTLFRVKLSLIAAGLVLGALLNSSLLKVGEEYAPDNTSTSMQAKTVAVLSLACWFAAIFTGRWLAYSTFADIGVGGG